MTAYLLILGEREAVAWVLRESRMAFPPTRRSEVNRLTAGDDLFVLTTRGCWHNPARDRTRIIDTARVTSEVTAYEEPVTIAGREFTRGCGIALRSLAPYLTGVELAPLVPRLEAFPDARSWSIRLRRPLLELGAPDAALLAHALDGVTREPASVIPDYLSLIRPVRQAPVLD
ncbi:hypothetical protein [Microbispora amethystogenes]|uniref:Transcriptional regulator n=1 Tax=Microbispora amethystogenes TaxID=1427754 RepID=A0ABQ4FMY1_9ACTN|nr:hypothetical protein [Microbispora amethystogenes]GIH36179.1 hypothetical protein Mam01_63430 [Microbispora amethystogenes]